MTKEEIIELAEQVGLIYWTHNRWWIDAGEPSEEFEDFVKLFKARIYGDAYRAGAFAERENILEMSKNQWFKTQKDYDEAIRARS